MAIALVACSGGELATDADLATGEPAVASNPTSQLERVGRKDLAPIPQPTQVGTAPDSAFPTPTWTPVGGAPPTVRPTFGAPTMTPLCQETVGTFIEIRGRNIPLHERVCIQTFDEAKRIARVQVAGGQSYIDINVDEAVGTDGVAYGDDAELFKVITEYVRSQSPPEPDLAPTPTRAPWSPPGASPTPWTGSRTEIGKAYPFTSMSTAACARLPSTSGVGLPHQS